VARFFRKLGRHHQAVMNRVLRSFMLAKLAALLAETEGEIVADAEADEVAQLQQARELELVAQLAALRNDLGDRFRFERAEPRAV